MCGCETWATTKYLLSRLDAFDTWALREILRIPYTRHVSMWKSEEPLVVHRFLTWWLIDVCGSLAILLVVHLARTTTEPLQRVSDKYRPTGSDQQENLATVGSVQLRQTLAIWSLASRLPGVRPVLEMNGDILWTQQRSSRVRSERKRRTLLTVNYCLSNRHSCSMPTKTQDWKCFSVHLFLVVGKVDMINHIFRILFSWKLLSAYFAEIWLLSTLLSTVVTAKCETECIRNTNVCFFQCMHAGQVSQHFNLHPNCEL